VEVKGSVYRVTDIKGFILSHLMNRQLPTQGTVEPLVGSNVRMVPLVSGNKGAWRNRAH
jgi:hypothetical protein